MLGVYRAVNGRILEKEIDIEPITVTLEKLTAKAIRRYTISVRDRTV